MNKIKISQNLTKTALKTGKNSPKTAKNVPRLRAQFFAYAAKKFPLATDLQRDRTYCEAEAKQQTVDFQSFTHLRREKRERVSD